MNNGYFILLLIFVVVAVVTMLYLIYTFRRIGITTKKLDYLIEDLTFKSETLNITIDAITKLSTYVDVLDFVVKNHGQDIIESFQRNPEVVSELKSKLQESFGAARQEVASVAPKKIKAKKAEVETKEKV